MARLVLLLLSVGACARPSLDLWRQHAKSGLDYHYASQPERRENARASVIQQARAFVAGAPLEVSGYRFTADPVGFVRAAYWSAGLELVDDDLVAQPQAHGMEMVFRSVSRRGALHDEQPRPADLVFFDEGKIASYPTQVAIVESVDVEGTISAVGWFANGPARVRLNLRNPSDPAHNDRLGGRNRLSAATLFRTFADPFRG